jgi:hypothetical protein
VIGRADGGEDFSSDKSDQTPYVSRKSGARSQEGVLVDALDMVWVEGILDQAIYRGRRF